MRFVKGKSWELIKSWDTSSCFACPTASELRVSPKGFSKAALISGRLTEQGSLLSKESSGRKIHNLQIASLILQLILSSTDGIIFQSVVFFFLLLTVTCKVYLKKKIEWLYGEERFYRVWNKLNGLKLNLGWIWKINGKDGW